LPSEEASAPSCSRPPRAPRIAADADAASIVVSTRHPWLFADALQLLSSLPSARPLADQLTNEADGRLSQPPHLSISLRLLLLQLPLLVVLLVLVGIFAVTQARPIERA